MRSSQQGVAEIPEMPKGKIRVQVIAKGYQTFGQTFDVNEDERTIEVQLNRPQPQYSAPRCRQHRRTPRQFHFPTRIAPVFRFKAPRPT